MEYVEWASFAASLGLVQIRIKYVVAVSQVVESQVMGPLQFLVLIHCDNQRILVGLSPQGFAHLGQWTSDATPPDPSFAETLKAVDPASE